MSICNLDYINRLEQVDTSPPVNPVSYPHHKHKKTLILVLLSTLTIAGIVLINNFYFTTNQQLITPVSQDIALDNHLAGSNVNSQEDRSLLGQLVIDDSPITTRVAGVSIEAGPQENLTGEFQLLTGDRSCQRQLVFALGDVESELSAHPADEFNWVGALDVLPEFPTPFVIGQHQVGEFPWRTELASAKAITITFEWPTETDAPAIMVLGWRAGTQGTKALAVSLNHQNPVTSPAYSAQPDHHNWQQMHQVEDSFSLSQLVQGTNYLSLKPIINSGDPIVWDYLRLELENCP